MPWPLPSVVHTGGSHHTQTPQYSLGVMACHSFKRTQANPLYLPEIFPANPDADLRKGVPFLTLIDISANLGD